MSSSVDRILIFVVTYNAADHIASTLDRISREWLDTLNYELLIIDDASTDQTKLICEAYAIDHPQLNITVIANQQNLGYGGNQKLGYQHAIDNDFAVVVLLHGDGQYSPSHLPNMVTPILRDEADIVLGSRMLDKVGALKGNMPLYKWVGNQLLTTLQNLLLKTSLAEFHTGYRAFSVDVLKRINFSANSDYFDFDTEILIQVIDRDYHIKEVSIPTFYGDEISYVNGFKYAWLILWATLKSRFVRLGWAKDPRFSV